MYIYNFFIDFIKCLCILEYTIRYDTRYKKNQKSIHDTIHLLTTMASTIDQGGSTTQIQKPKN